VFTLFAEECLHRVLPIGERHVRHTIAEFVEHYISNAIIRDSITS